MQRRPSKIRCRPLVNVMIADGKVTVSYRAWLFAAACRCGADRLDSTPSSLPSGIRMFFLPIAAWRCVGTQMEAQTVEMLGFEALRAESGSPGRSHFGIHKKPLWQPRFM